MVVREPACTIRSSTVRSEGEETVSTLIAPVTLTAFGKGRFESPAGPDMTVSDVLGKHGVQTNGQRVALNGHSATLDTPVQEHDELTMIPRVVGG
jgi:molybdopterin converting factor small subunit